MSVYSWAQARMEATRRLVPHTGFHLSGQVVVSLVAVAIVIGLVVSVYFVRGLLDLDLSQAGYPAIAALSFFASAGLLIPVPGLASVCAGGLLLSPLLVALVAGTTGTVGELTGYALGYSGRGVLKKGRLYQRMEHWVRRRGWLLIFLLSVLPNPIFDVVGIAAGALRYPLWAFLAIVWVGTFLKFVIVVYACAHGLEGVSRFFGL